MIIDMVNILLLGLTVFFEAGGETYDCRLGVANVIKNRVESRLFANSYYDVVFQPRHFSCYNLNEVDRHLNRVLEKNIVELRSLKKCIQMSDSVYNNLVYDNTNSSLWYSLKYKRKFSRKQKLFKVWMKNLKVRAEYGSEDNPTVFYGL